MTESLIVGEEPNIPDLLVRAFADILDGNDSEPSLLAFNITVPGLNYLIEQFERVSFDELVLAHNKLKQHLAVCLKEKLLAVYHKAIAKVAEGNDNPVGWRRLQNASLLLLAETKQDEITQLALQQFNDSETMTNSLAALTVIAHSKSTDKSHVLETFYKRWQDEELVLDKWFAVQATNASESVIDDIKQLVDHADFHLTNPNKVRALFASFAKGNLENFHRIDGQGYQLLADIIIKLNKLNPQIAARLTAAFNSWRNFDDQRQVLMQTQLKRIAELENISVDVYEIASKALL